MSGNGKAPDKVDAAIQAASTPAPMLPLRIKLEKTSGREVQIAVPLDLAWQELVELLGWLADGLPKVLAAAQQPSAILVPPRGIVVPPS